MLRNNKKTQRITKRIAILMLIFMGFVGCQQKNTLEGLWRVESVQVGENSMTPIARWMRFEADGTQTSGNGWLQHSFGTWSLNNNILDVVDENGIREITDPFSIEIQENTMTWKRSELGEEVVVSLKRIEKIPQSEGNKLVGLWKLLQSTDDGNDITAMINPDGKSMLHLRWDNTYVQYFMPKGKKYGVYKIHAHKPEIQLVNYGNESKFSFWSFAFKGEKLTLTSTDQKSVMTFERIHQYIQ